MTRLPFDSMRWIAVIVLIQIIAGLIAVGIRSISVAIGLFVFGLGMYLIYKNKNINGEAHFFSAYIMGAEVFFRMTASGLPWEFTRYAIVALLGFGLVMETRDREKPWFMLLYFVLMLPSIYLTMDYYSTEDFDRIRKTISFNLFGPFLLTLSMFYFYKRKFTLVEFEKFSRWMVYPIIMTSAYIFLNVGDYSTVEFTYSSNAQSSGGFSGNQVSIVFGLGILIVGLNILLGNKLFYSSLIDTGLVIIFIFQGLMTFSRGGLLGSVLALSFGAFLYYFSNIQRFLVFIKMYLLKLILAGIIGTSAFIYTDEMTGGFLYARYFNVKEDGYKVKDDVTTGRGDISVGDIKLFTDRDYVGVGVGVSSKERSVMKDFAAHIEFTRMLAEHGLLGVISLLILILFPFVHFIKIFQHGETLFIFTTFMALSLLSMTHSAMRLGMIGFLYAAAFIYISYQKENKDSYDGVDKNDKV